MRSRRLPSITRDPSWRAIISLISWRREGSSLSVVLALFSNKAAAIPSPITTPNSRWTSTRRLGSALWNMRDGKLLDLLGEHGLPSFLADASEGALLELQEPSFYALL